MASNASLARVRQDDKVRAPGFCRPRYRGLRFWMPVPQLEVKFQRAISDELTRLAEDIGGQRILLRQACAVSHGYAGLGHSARKSSQLKAILRYSI